MKLQHHLGKKWGSGWGGLEEGGAPSYLWVGEVSDPGGVRAAAAKGLWSAGGAWGGRQEVAMEKDTRCILMPGGGTGRGERAGSAAAAGKDVGAVCEVGGMLGDPLLGEMGDQQASPPSLLGCPGWH